MQITHLSHCRTKQYSNSVVHDLHQINNLLSSTAVQTSSQELWPMPGYDLNCDCWLNLLINCEVMLPKL